MSIIRIDEVMRSDPSQARLPHDARYEMGSAFISLDIMVSEKYIRIHPKAVDPAAKNFHWMDMKSG